MQDDVNRKLSAPVSSRIIMAALVAAALFGSFVGYQIGFVTGTSGAWNQLSELSSSAALAAPESNRVYPPNVVSRCLDGVSMDPAVDCAAVLASLPEPKTSHDMAIAAVLTIDTSCPSPTTRQDGKCVLTSDAVLTKTLWLSSGTTLDCQGYRMTPSVDGQSGGLGSNPEHRPLRSSVPSVPNTAVLLAGDTSGVTVKNCVIENFDFGIVIANSKIADAAKQGGGNLITGNTLNNRYRGVQIIASDDNRIVDNQIHSFAVSSAGIIIAHDSDDNLIKGNTYVGPSSYAWGPAPLYPGDMDEVDHGWIGEAVVVKGPVFSYNFKVGNKTFRGTSNPQGWAERNVIEGNDVDLPNRWGTAIMAHSASDGTVIRGNTVRRAAVALRAVNPSKRYANSQNALIEDNTVLGPAWVGIYIGSTDNAVVRNNTVRNMGEVGIVVTWQALRSATVTKNLVTDSPIGLELYTSTPADPYHAKIFQNDFIAQEVGVVASGLAAPVDLSFEGKGNYWGHSEPPAFRATDSSDPSLATDSYASLVPVSGLLDD